MTVPKFKNKHGNDSIRPPEELMAYFRKRGLYPEFGPPKGVILCYQRALMDHVRTAHEVREVQAFGTNLYLLGETDAEIGIVGNFGIGAPAAAHHLERLIGFGVRRFISIGAAGGLQKNLKIGDLVVCNRAIRDEGTSYHYIRSSKYAYPSKEMTRRIIACLDRIHPEYHVGASWTIDAPFQETIAEVKRYQEEGVTTVEMEASALFAVAQCRNVEIGAIFSISDLLGDMVWNVEFHSEQMRKGLESLYKVAVQALQGG